MNLDDKIEIVKDILRDEKVAVGFSGGADSTLIAYLASKVSKDVLAITIDNHLLPEGFIEHTQRMAQKFDIKQHIIDLNFYSDEDLVANLPSRCYYCRNWMYENIEKYARENGFDFICDGNNISDLVIDRPGILVTYKKKFKTPFIEAKLTSKEIHEYLNKNNISYSKSTTCLATRIPTNTKFSREKISRIKKAETILSKVSRCDLVKVRDINNIALCEVNDFSKVMNEDTFNEINDSLKQLEFKKVGLNLVALDDDDDVIIDYCEGRFQYKLPFTINIEETKKHLTKKIISQNTDKIKLEKMSIREDGVINGFNFKSHEEALFEFMDLLKELRRNV